MLLNKVKPMTLTPGLRKKIISAYIILNFATVVWVNSAQWRYWARSELSGKIPPYIERILDTAGVIFQRYSALTGLYGVWEMFNYADRSQFMIFVKAEYANSATWVLPIAWQSERTFWQEKLFDVKSGKFFVNMAALQNVRRVFAFYLCRTFSSHNGSPIRKIIFEQNVQRVRNPKEAMEKGYHLDPEVSTSVKDIFQCQ